MAVVKVVKETIKTKSNGELIKGPHKAIEAMAGDTIEWTCQFEFRVRDVQLVTCICSGGASCTHPGYPFVSPLSPAFTNGPVTSSVKPDVESAMYKCTYDTRFPGGEDTDDPHIWIGP